MVLPPAHAPLCSASTAPLPRCSAPLRASPLPPQTPNASLRFAKVEQCGGSSEALHFASPPSACFAGFGTPLRSADFVTPPASLRTRYSLRFASLVFISRPPSQGGELRPPHCPRWASLAAPLRFAILYINGNLIMFSAVMRHRLKHNPVYVKYPASPAPLLPSLRFASFGACFASLRPPSSVAPLRYAPPASSLRFVAPLRSAPFFNAPLRVAPLRNDIFSIAIFPRTLRVLQNPPQKNVGKRFYLTKVKYS